MSSQKLQVLVLGVGLVGKQVIHQLLSDLPTHLASQFSIVWLANSKQRLHVAAGLTGTAEDALSQLSKTEPHGLSLSKVIEEIVELAEGSRGKYLFVDNTSSQDVANLYPTLVGAGIHLVTPSKKAFSSSATLYADIFRAATQSKAIVLREATVGAGLPIISTLDDLINTGDTILKIEGVLSGTLSFLFNEYSQPKPTTTTTTTTTPFSQILRGAKEAGYTEPHPGDDLNGSDVARKLTILARMIPSLSNSDLLKEGFLSVPTQSLVPAALQDIQDGSDFVQKLPDFDADFAKQNKEAAQAGCVLRYVGVLDPQSGHIKAGLERYPFDHPFASSLSGSDNIISFTTKRYSPNPLIIQGAGAGAAVTAMGVVANAIKIAQIVLPL
ncbi:uncharacterized protein L969DRAFT_84941 [Mixia osmundae IAM 14324]|uniref:Homoserine dehydrogenase n=1 Tax=Mixia osmundae (strain CBS 9802 / IAM 14324 / JCM 22182 / KY 12970) TaxID=764103 RepID=G7DXK8_MIXOS|nr:uncharacterized protein L969DRAFT_84941 [Mixia osmundae IAM 14324]KEI41188.1 hypothetical protein L969DRAFT_84941 [Mixia osmundae IAM 14324]GAA95318.1 hypothetical protein E5Q_01975 [Mixia osmundae IAM 14324]